jgi:hypothetical protein
VVAIVLGAAALLVGGAIGAIWSSFPRGTVERDALALAHLRGPGLGSRLDRIMATGPGGQAVPVRVTAAGAIVPAATVRAGTALHVVAEWRRPSWAAWLVGQAQREELSVVAPSASLQTRWTQAMPDGSVQVAFDAPVSVLEVTLAGARAREVLPAPATVVTLPRRLTAARAGTVAVAGAARGWEALTKARPVTWFPAGQALSAIVEPAVGSRLTPRRHLLLRFSQPVAEVLGSARPRVAPSVPGRWRSIDDHTIAFAPSGLGYPFGSTVTVSLPRAVAVGRHGRIVTRRSLVWHVPPASPRRVPQLLARLGYLPLVFESRRPVARSTAAQLAAAVSPPAGSFRWRYGRRTPKALEALWQPGRPNVILQGAIMTFEDEHGLPADGLVGPNLLTELITAAVHDPPRTGGYTFVQVSEHIPERLLLWHNGKVLFTALANTGIGAAPTVPGTWPVFEHIPVGTMSGTNPDGSHYSDPGIQWISYFHGGDALHAFIRPSYGVPQSLGCVEMTTADAARVYPYTPIGTLVNVQA